MWQEGFFIDHRFPWRISLLRAISSFWSDRRQLSCAPILRIQRLSKDRSGFFLRALCVLCGKVCSDFPDPRLSAYIRGKLLLFRFSALFASFAVKKFCSIARSTFVFLRALCGKKLLRLLRPHKPSASTCSSVSKPSQCATSCQTTCFTSARKSPFEHRRMGPRKTNIKSGAYCNWANDRFVLNMPLYSPSNSVPCRHFSRSAISRNTSGGGSSST
jgi:hypothetical protein